MPDSPPLTRGLNPPKGCLCGDGCISAYDNQPCDCFCDGDPDGKHHYDYLNDPPAAHSHSCRCDDCWSDAVTELASQR